MDRRDFLNLSAAGLASALAVRPLALVAAREGDKPLVLAHQEWASLEIACDILLPPVQRISTGDAGCVNFIDKLLANEDESLLGLYRGSLAALDEYARANGGSTWRALDRKVQIKSMEQMEDAVIHPWPDYASAAMFFGVLRFHTLLGFLAAPSHGGNRDGAGWHAVGFPGHLHMQGGISDAQVSGANE